MLVLVCRHQSNPQSVDCRTHVEKEQKRGERTYPWRGRIHRRKLGSAAAVDGGEFVLIMLPLPDGCKRRGGRDRQTSAMEQAFPHKVWKVHKVTGTDRMQWTLSGYDPFPHCLQATPGQMLMKVSASVQEDSSQTCAVAVLLPPQPLLPGVEAGVLEPPLQHPQPPPPPLPLFLLLVRHHPPDSSATKSGTLHPRLSPAWDGNPAPAKSGRQVDLSRGALQGSCHPQRTIPTQQVLPWGFPVRSAPGIHRNNTHVCHEHENLRIHLPPIPLS